MSAAEGLRGGPVGRKSRRAEDNLFGNVHSAPDLSHACGLPRLAYRVSGPFRTQGVAFPTARLKSGAIELKTLAASSARRDFRPTD
jgi:hypothetical protein